VDAEIIDSLGTMADSLRSNPSFFDSGADGSMASLVGESPTLLRCHSHRSSESDCSLIAFADQTKRAKTASGVVIESSKTDAGIVSSRWMRLEQTEAPSVTPRASSSSGINLFNTA
jgi:hypothetical protein